MIEPTQAAPGLNWGFPPRLAVVLGLGALTSGLALTVVFFVSRGGTNLMLWHHLVVLPVGPLVVGLISSTGFALGARLAGLRARGVALAAIGLLLVGAYLGAEYVGFRVDYPHGVVDPTGRLLTFWTYLDFITRSTHFEGKPELGLWGYALRLLGLAGFLLGGVWAPLALAGRRPHCPGCNRFHRQTVVAHVPAERQAELDAALAHPHDGRALATRLQALAPPESWPSTSQLPARLLVRFSRCTGCDQGLLVWEELAGLPAQERGLERGRLELPADRVREFVSAWPAA